MNRQTSEKLIREYVKQVLDEQTSPKKLNEYIFDDSGGSGGYIGSGSDLYSTFIQPFVDVAGTVVGKTKEVMRRGMTVLNVAFEALMTSLVPFLTDSYDEIFAQEKADLQKIQGEYQKYYDSTNKALDSSVKTLAFLAFPGAALTGKFVKDSPDIARGILSVATGGVSDKYLSGGGGKTTSSKSKGPSSVFDSYARAYDKLLQEAEDSTTLADKIGSKKFIDAILSKSPAIQSAAKQAQQIYKKNLGERIKPVLEILAAKNIEELGKILGKQIKSPDFNELDPDKKLSEKDREMKFLESVRKTSISAAIKQLKDYVAPVRSEFGNDHPFVKGYDNVIAAIESGDAKRLEQVKKQLGLSQ